MWMIYILIVILILVGYELIRKPSVSLIKSVLIKLSDWLKGIASK